MADVCTATATSPSLVGKLTPIGSYLRRGGKVILDSLSKVYAAFITGQPEMEVNLQGQPLMEVVLRVSQEPLAVKLNCQSVDVDYSEANESMTFIVNAREKSSIVVD